jgi:hypothetical protein
MTNTKAAIAILVAVHVITGLILSWLAGPRPPSFLQALFIGVVFSQASLLGFWGGLGTNHWLVRFVGVVVGMAYLGPMFGIGIRELTPDTLFIVFLSTPTVTVVLLVIRRLGAQLLRSNEAMSIHQQGLQFSIRHLMLLTFVVGCVLGVGRLLSPEFPGVHALARLLTISFWSRIDALSVLAIFSLCFVSVGVTTVWAMLGSHFLLRSVGVLLVAVSSGGILSFGLVRSEHWFWFSVTLAEAAFLLTSLWIVRLCGYRLVRLSRIHTPSLGNE